MTDKPCNQADGYAGPLTPVELSGELKAILRAHAPTDEMMDPDIGINPMEPIYRSGCPILPESDD